MTDHSATKIHLQNLLDSTPYHGVIIDTFASGYGLEYEVGLAQLDTGEKVIVKIKQEYMGVEKATHSREFEYQNLLMLEKLGNPLFPKPIYYKDAVLIMSFLPGLSLAKFGIENAKPDFYQELGKIFRKINDIPLENAPHLPRLNSIQEFFEEKIKWLREKRLALDIFPQSFYDEICLRLREKIPSIDTGNLGVIWRDANSNNILTENDTLSGLIDFEDMGIGPRFIQLRTFPMSAEQKKSFMEGYGIDLYEKTYDETFDKVIGVISTLNAIYLANKKNDKAWLEQNISSLKQGISNLDLNELHI